MRGQKFFNELMMIPPPVIKYPSKRRGRNTDLVSLRNECLVARYYFYTQFTRKGYEEIVERIVEEFYLTPERIARIIQENAQLLQLFRTDGTTIYTLRQKWTYLKWWH